MENGVEKVFVENKRRAVCHLKRGKRFPVTDNHDADDMILVLFLLPQPIQNRLSFAVYSTTYHAACNVASYTRLSAPRNLWRSERVRRKWISAQCTVTLLRSA